MTDVFRLDREGREYIRFPFNTTADDLAVVQVNLTGEWIDGTIEAPDDPLNWTGDAVILCAGPDAPVLADPPAAVIPLGTHHARVRFPDNPELIIRGGGYVIVE